MIVIDSSVALKWLRQKGEEFIKESLTLLTRHLNNQEEILTPTLLYAEAANALATKTDTTAKQVVIDLNKLFEAKLKTTEVTQQELNEAVKLAKKYRTSVYDMLYAVIAKSNKVKLITADQKFIQKTGFSFVKHISQMR